MSEPVSLESATSQTRCSADKRLRRRHRAEQRFRAYGLVAIGLALLTLGILFASIVIRGSGAFFHSVVSMEIYFDPELVDPAGQRTPESLGAGNYAALVKRRLRELFPEVTGRKDERRLYRLLSNGAAYELRDAVLGDPNLVGRTATLELALSDDADLYLKGHVSRDISEDDRKLRNHQLGWLDALAESGAVKTEFNWAFLLSGDSREPELAGIGGAFVGSLLTLLITLLLCFPLGVASAIYLEEFAPKSRWTDLIEININNLAAVPSVIFGILGLSIFLGTFGLPRSAPLVGGLVLGIRTLPIVIISARAALAAVPPSIREAAMAIGASPLQVVGHHVMPHAIPGILTGTIIGMAQALGETAPLLMIGMVAFVVDIPTGLDSPATVLPVQIFLWADAPERAFAEKTAGAVLVLLALLVSMNASAIWLRQRFEQRSVAPRTARLRCKSRRLD
ncbi:MAG: phosphate ABC transporter permease PstA [Deltaproteobacteria bacterium]|nr:phosphate ABC transporter permease PstA [Deltaproteobacteria bacterium]